MRARTRDRTSSAPRDRGGSAAPSDGNQGSGGKASGRNRRGSGKGGSGRSGGAKSGSGKGGSSKGDAGKGNDGGAGKGGGSGRSGSGKASSSKGGGSGKGQGRNRSQNNRNRSRNRRQRRSSGGSSFWGDPARLPAPRTDVRITDDPAAIPRSLGQPPLPGHEVIAEHYFSAVYDRAVATAGALAAAGGLIDPNALVEDDDRD